MLENVHATVVLASGELAEVTAERIVYSAETADMFERAVAQSSVVGNAALRPVELDAWATYNFEVEDLHTYIAGGVRVHNDSGLLGEVGNIFSNGKDRFVHDGFWDTVGDHVSNALHDAGTAIDGFLPAVGKAVDDILSGDAFKSKDGRFGGWADDGHSEDYEEKYGVKDGRVSTYLNGSGFNTERFYGGGAFKDQKYQPGGDYDNDGTLSSKDLAARNADLYEKFTKTAETAQEREYYARRAEDYRKEAESGSSSSSQAGSGGSSSGSQSSKPVLLDLNGNGVEITEFDKSTIFMNGGDGLKHRISWAAADDGVLFFDGDQNGEITDQREYVFTEWAPTAGGDLEAIRQVRDTNHDGKLTAADTDFAKFKVMVTNADGSTSVQTLAQLGITEINLTANATNITLPDGSVITGQTTFAKADGTMGTVANTTLVADANGYRVVEMVGSDASGNRVVTQTGYAADGKLRTERGRRCREFSTSDRQSPGPTLAIYDTRSPKLGVGGLNQSPPIYTSHSTTQCNRRLHDYIGRAPAQM